jgi:MOSC domain-containing protein YiiM
MAMDSRVVSVNVAGTVRPSEHGYQGRTGIDKRPATGRVALRGDQLAGDHIADTRHHGGYDQAVYAYAREDAAWWAGELGRELPPGSFGENLTTEHIDVTGAVIGERWAVGSAVLEVSSPRIPCRVFAGFWDVQDLVKRFTARGWPGAYLRIVAEGDVGAGDPIAVVRRPEHRVTIGEVFRCFTGERALAVRVAAATELPERHHDRLRTWLAEPA